MLKPHPISDVSEDALQQASQETEHRLRQIIDNITAVVFLKDTEGRYQYANKRCLQLFGREESEVIGRRDTDVFPAEIAGRFQANDREVLETHRAREFEETIVQEDGPHTYLSMKFPVVDAAGRTTALCGIASDITDRKRMEDVFRDAALAVSAARSDALYKELVRYLANLLMVDFAFIAVVDPDGPRMMHMRAFYANGRIIENMEYPLAGTPCETVVGQSFRFYPTGVTARFPADVEFKTMCVEGYAGFPLNDSRGQPIGLIAVVSRKPLSDPQLIESSLKIFAVRAAAEIERTRAEEALRASEAQYRAIFSTALDGMLVVAADGTVVDANPAFQALFGYERESLVGRLAGNLLPPEDRKLSGQLLDMARAGQAIQVECRGLRQDGSIIYVEVRGAPMQHEGRPHLLFIARDISRRKQAETARAVLESQLRQAQKMEAIGQLTGGIAHDFNNILTSILGYLALAEERPAATDDGKLARYLRQAGLSARRARDLIQQMLTFSRGQRGNPEAVHLPDLVRESLNLLGSMLPSTIELRTGPAAPVPSVMLDPVQANQVLLNLCINARDAMGGTGTLRVDVRQHAGLNMTCSSCRKPVQGDFIELAVSDTGPGISPQTADRMFEPFFTTKEVGKGTGMGLATVHGIVHEHDGHVVVESVPGQGATFRVFYPSIVERADAGAGQPAADEGGAAAGEARRLAGRVLLADDDAMVRDYMRDLLEGWGLEVTSAENGAVAYDVFASIPGRFDLVITDQTMPRMTGLQLAEQLLSRHPDVPVILYTGYSDGLGEDEVTARGIRALVRKPIDTGVLFDLLVAELALSA